MERKASAVPAAVWEERARSRERTYKRTQTSVSQVCVAARGSSADRYIYLFCCILNHMHLAAIEAVGNDVYSLLPPCISARGVPGHGLPASGSPPPRAHSCRVEMSVCPIVRRPGEKISQCRSTSSAL